MSVVEKVRYWSRELPEGPFDYVVIGSGMGGMTAAALLSKMGKRVSLKEDKFERMPFSRASLFQKLALQLPGCVGRRHRWREASG